MKQRSNKAAIRAGYSPQTAYSIGEENLRKPEIKSRIDKAMAAHSGHELLGKTRVLAAISKGEGVRKPV